MSSLKPLKGRAGTVGHLRELAGVISPVIHIGQFKLDAEEVLDDYHMDTDETMGNDEESIAKDLCTDVGIVKELEELCSAERLKCPRDDEVHNWDDVRQVPLDTGLETIQNWLQLNKMRLESKLSTTVLKSKYTDYDCNLQDAWNGVEAKEKKDKINPPETIITVAVNFPRTLRRFKHTTVNFRVLGSQNLTELRDVIPCPLDQQPIGRFTDDPDLPKDIVCKDLFKAGYFFIHNTFYHDHRSESTGDDLSKPVLNRAKEQGLEFPENLQQVNMEDYCFDDLHLCLGAPYIYVHQGNCEHIIVFKDIRLLHPDDCMSRSAYPISMSRSKTKSPACKVCDFFTAKWMTTNDEFSDEDPSFFCDACFRMLHYNKDGTCAGSFEAFPYVGREVLFY